MRIVLSPLLIVSSVLGVTAIPSFDDWKRDDNGSDSDSSDNSTDTGSWQEDPLSKYCAAQFQSFAKTYQSTQIATSRWTWYEGFGPTDSAGDLTGPVTSQSYWTSTFLCKLNEAWNDRHHFCRFVVFDISSIIYPKPTLNSMIVHVSRHCLHPFDLSSSQISLHCLHMFFANSIV